MSLAWTSLNIFSWCVWSDDTLTPHQLRGTSHCGCIKLQKCGRNALCLYKSFTPCMIGNSFRPWMIGGSCKAACPADVRAAHAKENRMCATCLCSRMCVCMHCGLQCALPVVTVDLFANMLASHNDRTIIHNLCFWCIPHLPGYVEDHPS